MKIEKFKFAAGSGLICKHCRFLPDQRKTQMIVKNGTNILKFNCPSCNKKNKVKFTATAVLTLEK